MVVVILLVVAGFVVGLMPDPEDMADAWHHWRAADHSGYSVRELRRITASVRRKDRRRPRYGINA